jgi:alkylation response protein AidB-like acyl-CoA dehydrogenase
MHALRSSTLRSSTPLDVESGAHHPSDIVSQYLAKYPDLPQPGNGQTLARWRVLAEIAATDLASAKILEAHYDALAILKDAGRSERHQGALWGVWAAEGPASTARLTPASMHLTGRKPWCSGARRVKHALVTVKTGEACQLVSVDMSEETSTIDTTHWHGPGMAAVETGTVDFLEAPASLVGEPDFYLRRPGFWHGGAGIAACWYGAATAVAETFRRSGHRGNPFAAAHLGAIDGSLVALRAQLQHLAERIDSAPHESHRQDVVRVRTIADRVCRDILERSALAMGPGPLCIDAEHGQRCADLWVFVRQSHAERDEQWLGEYAVAMEQNPWRL